MRRWLAKPVTKDMYMHAILYSCCGDALVGSHVVIMKKPHLVCECTWVGSWSYLLETT